MRPSNFYAVGLGLSLSLAAPSVAEAQYIKDLARVDGIRLQHMNGPGLVVGLPGTGDSTRSGLTKLLYANLLKALEIEVPEEELRARNVAVVMVTASVSSATKVGSTIEVTVSSMGDAKALRGGWLLETALMGPGEGGKDTIYAVAQGAVTLTHENEPTRGRGVAILEEDISIPFYGTTFDIILTRPDFSTATRVARAINEFPYFLYQVAAEMPLAHARDAGSIHVRIPRRFRGEDRVVDFMSRVMGEVQVPDVDRSATVVINKASAIVTVNGRVRVAPVFVSVGDLYLRIPPAADPEADASADPPEIQPLLIQVMDELRKQGVKSEQLPEIIRSIERAGALIGKLVEE